MYRVKENSQNLEICEKRTPCNITKCVIPIIGRFDCIRNLWLSGIFSYNNHVVFATIYRMLNTKISLVTMTQLIEGINVSGEIEVVERSANSRTSENWNEQLLLYSAEKSWDAIDSTWFISNTRTKTDAWSWKHAL